MFETQKGTTLEIGSAFWMFNAQNGFIYYQVERKK